MLVKINGILIDTERVMRFAPRRKGAIDFRPEDACSLDELERTCRKIKSHAERVWTVDRMGWRFLLMSDAYGNTFPQCFAPVSGKLEMA